MAENQGLRLHSQKPTRLYHGNFSKEPRTTATELGHLSSLHTQSTSCHLSELCRGWLYTQNKSSLPRFNYFTQYRLLHGTAFQVGATYGICRVQVTYQGPCGKEDWKQEFLLLLCESKAMTRSAIQNPGQQGIKANIHMMNGPEDSLPESLEP